MYSLLDGLSKVDALVNRAKDLGMEALALTDHGNLYGAVEFYKKATKAGIKPIIGCEVYVVDGSRLEKKGRDNIYHLILLAENNVGYTNLVKLVSDAQIEGFYYKPRTDHETLRKYSEGLICLSSCLGSEIGQALIAKDTDKAIAVAKEYKDIFGPDNFFLEIQPHIKMPEQDEVNRRVLAMAKKLKIPVVATQDSHYINSGDAGVHDVLLAVQTGAQVADEKRFRMDQDDFSLCSADEMEEKLGEIGTEGMENAVKIAERCSVKMKLGELQLPTFPLPEGWTDPFAYLEHLANQRIVERFGEDVILNAPVWQRLEYELQVIKQTGFATYFLIVQDFVNWAKQNGIAVGPGRGSAAGSLLSYILGITNIDPLKYDLLFERFLNPERISMPDIDLDFSDRRRGEVLKYVEDKYGKDHVAQIITFGTMAARAAVRDVCRALGVDYALADKLAKAIPFNPNQDADLKSKGEFLKHCIENVDEVKELYASEPQAKQVYDTAMKLEGVARHHGVHACAVVMTPNPLTDHLPIQHASDGETIVTQFELHAVEDLGLLKMDFLGLKNLTIIEDTLKMVEKNHSIKININELPLDDTKTFKLLQEAQTTGVFQLESPGMKKNLKKLKPSEIEDIIAMVALYRPGPMELIPDYIDRKHKRKKVEYLYPALEPVLKNTYGVMVYQEQLIEAVRVLAGFTRAEADVLRKAVGKKDKALLDKQEGKFKEGAEKTGTPKGIADKFWSLVEPFNRYAFNRSHAACYAMIAYQTAYLKANYPREFMAAFLNSETSSIEDLSIVIEECRNMKIKLLPPDINESGSDFVVSGKNIRFGLAGIKNVGEGIVGAIIVERQNGAFKSIHDLIARVDHRGINRRCMEALTMSGAFDTLGERGEILANLEYMLVYGKELRKHPDAILPVFTPVTAEAATKQQKMNWEKELIGLYISDHPLNAYRSQLTDAGIPAICDVELVHEAEATVGGMIGDVRKTLTKTGKQMVFVNLEDMSGRIRVIAFPQVYNRNKELWKHGNVVIIRGRMDMKGESPNLLCDEAKLLSPVEH